jgi:hypothetical protein
MRTVNFHKVTDNSIFRQRISLPSRQGGVVLVITLIVLVAMTLAAIALVRSVDTGNVVAGNMAFKQGAVQSADAGAEAAIAWLAGVAGIAASYSDIPEQGYYATSQEELDPTGNNGDPNHALIDWDGNDCNGAVAAGSASSCIEPFPANPGDALPNAAGYIVQYVIHRLCPSTGLPSNCASTSSIVSGTSSGAKDYTSKGGLSGESEVEYYRVTTRVKGPRNTVSHVETIIHF